MCEVNLDGHGVKLSKANSKVQTHPMKKEHPTLFLAPKKPFQFNSQEFVND